MQKVQRGILSGREYSEAMTILLNLPFVAIQAANCCLIVATAVAEGAIEWVRRKR